MLEISLTIKNTTDINLKLLKKKHQNINQTLLDSGLVQSQPN